jgi:hypothetical protein
MICFKDTKDLGYNIVNMNDTNSDWGGEEIDLHAPIKPVVVTEPPKPVIQTRPVKKPMQHATAEMLVEVDVDTPLVMAEVTSSPASKSTDSQNIKQAFMDAIASPLPDNADPTFRAQVDTARKSLGLVSSDQPASHTSIGPQAFENSADMKAAFTSALNSPLPPAITQEPPTPIVASTSEPFRMRTPASVDNLINKAKRIRKAPAEPVQQVEEPVLATFANAPAVVVAPTGKPAAQIDHHSRKITKFAPETTSEWAGSTNNPDADTTSLTGNPTPADKTKQFTIDDSVTNN